MIKKINHENWCPIHKEWIARNQLECFSCKLEKKEVLTLTEDKVNNGLFDIEWDLAEKTQELIKVLKAKPTVTPISVYVDYEKAIHIVNKLENLLDKRNNLLSAQCLFYDMGEKT